MNEILDEKESMAAALKGSIVMFLVVILLIAFLLLFEFYFLPAGIL